MITLVSTPRRDGAVPQAAGLALVRADTHLKCARPAALLRAKTPLAIETPLIVDRVVVEFIGVGVAVMLVADWFGVFVW